MEVEAGGLETVAHGVDKSAADGECVAICLVSKTSDDYLGGSCGSAREESSGIETADEKWNLRGKS